MATFRSVLFSIWTVRLPQDWQKSDRESFTGQMYANAALVDLSSIRLPHGILIKDIARPFKSCRLMRQGWLYAGFVLLGQKPRDLQQIASYEEELEARQTTPCMPIVTKCIAKSVSHYHVLYVLV